MNKKLEALSKYLEVEPSKLSELDSNVIEYQNEEYLILNDSEANEAVEYYIKENAWAFNSKFLASHMTNIDSHDLKHLQELCERANPIILKLIDNIDRFIHDVILFEGRGHFISSYNNKEIELDGGFFAYRIN